MHYAPIIEIVYLSAGEVISKRRLSIDAIQKDKLRAYCHLRQACRTFYFDRILAVFPVIYEEKEVE